MQNQISVGGAPLKYSGPIDCYRKILATEGVAGLYRGLKPNLIGVTPEKSIKLSVNDLLRERFTAASHDGRSIRLYEEMLAGGGAGFLQVAATNPMVRGREWGGAMVRAHSAILDLTPHPSHPAGNHQTAHAAGGRVGCVRHRRVHHLLVGGEKLVPRHPRYMAA